MLEINGDLCHNLLLDKQEKKLAFSEDKNFDSWRAELREKLYELLGMDLIEKNACPLNFTIEEEVEFDTYKRIRFVFESEIGSLVPCYLLIPKNGKKKFPLAITLQGHSTGFHNSVGIPIYEGDEDYINTRGAFALQAVENGYAALAIEQRAFGERKTRLHKEDLRMCSYQAFTAFQLGRTIVGERIWDISKAIDVMSAFSDVVDLDKILIAGNSGGGTASFYAGIYDERIKLTAPSCSFCSYKTSIMPMYHCGCNYIPGALKWFEMEDLSALIAPRPFVVFAGEKDPIFPIQGVKDSYAIVEKIYEKAGAKDKCRLVTHEKAHWWHTDIVWNTLNEEAKKLGW